ncbi:MAG: SDR family oxidoreductase [Boseongicola sp. SB0664_bin_43]|uniref:SDR family oxidoreductase n=1 Tax=Boseongicola sp. SB0664_bin_43 TaxID=2604844 RepID=A0A6B0Y285_9RHOB|nr:SDR family oxidoreductase [Boseongicola sp. SB0664_bin_43]
MATPTVLITGASKGIGRAMAEHLATEGWQVIATSRREPEMPFVSQQIVHRVADVASEQDVRGLFSDLSSESTRLSGLVNNAALQGGRPIHEQELADWQAMLDTNLTGTWLVTKHALPVLADGASVVNVGSVASVAGFAGRSAYCASKHGILGLTRALAAEFAPRGIRVNHLCLGSFDTPGLQEVAKASGRPVADFADRQLLGRLGDPCEAAEACAFLLSDKAGFITGTSLTADGGLLNKGTFG